jgi:septum formation protein
MKILLGSNSPRRKELLQNLGFDFEVVSINCDEIFPDNLEVKNIASYLSELKANAYRNLEKNEILLTADTVVTFEGKVLGKPKNREEAIEMLSHLSGKTHQVYTGISFKNTEKIITKTDVADVEFSKITDEEIAFYIKNYQPFDKAGSYGIQEWLGMAKISRINGSFYTIMGLPTHLVYETLKDLGF